MTQGTKRASPGAEEEKDPLQGVELSDEDATKLNDVAKDIERTELILGMWLVFYYFQDELLIPASYFRAPCSTKAQAHL
jgi:hypothetical protein